MHCIDEWLVNLQRITLLHVSSFEICLCLLCCLIVHRPSWIVTLWVLWLWVAASKMHENSGSTMSSLSSVGGPRQPLQRRSSRVLQRQLTQDQGGHQGDDGDSGGGGVATKRPPLPAPPRTLTRSMSRGRRENQFEVDDGPAGFGGHPGGTPKTDKQKILLKRLKNKEAAARCRQKKIDTIKNLEKVLEVRQSRILILSIIPILMMFPPFPFQTQAEERRRLEKVAVNLRTSIQTLEVSLATHKPECGLFPAAGNVSRLPHVPQVPRQECPHTDNVMSTLRVARPGTSYSRSNRIPTHKISEMYSTFPESLQLGPPPPPPPEFVLTPSTTMALENVIHAFQETAPDNPFSDFTSPLNNYMSLWFKMFSWCEWCHFGHIKLFLQKVNQPINRTTIFSACLFLSNGLSDLFQAILFIIKSYTKSEMFWNESLSNQEAQDCIESQSMKERIIVIIM